MDSVELLGQQQAAFRDGVLEAKDKSLQKGFDEGLEDSYENFAAINVLKGIVKYVCVVVLTQPMTQFVHSVVHFAVNSDNDRTLLDQIVQKIENLEQSLQDFEKLEPQRQHLVDQLNSTKGSLKQLCSNVELESVHAQIDECVFKFNEKALERLSQPLNTD